MVQERRILYEHLDVPDINTPLMSFDNMTATPVLKRLSPNINLTKSLKW